MQKAQRILMLVLPIVFIPFILHFPSGLMIYWMTTNLWTTGQGFVTRRLMPKPDLTVRRSSKTPPKEQPSPAPPKSKQRSGPTQPAAESADGSGRAVAGPPRRVKRKRSGGGRRR